MTVKAYLILIFIIVLSQIFLPSPASSQVFPTREGESGFNAVFLRNIDEFDNHWGGKIGYVWKGRLNANLEWRKDGILGKDMLVLQGNLALIRTAGLAVEVGYHRTLKSSRSHPYHLTPLRVSFLFETFKNLYLSPSMTAWHVWGYDDIVPLAFGGLDFYWKRKISLGLELNVNRDFRCHYLDIKLGYHW